MLNSYEIEKMNKESMEKVVNFFQYHTHGTAKEIGASGSFLRSLVDRHFMAVVGKQEGDFFPIGNGLYKRAEVNIYGMVVSTDTLWDNFIMANHREGMRQKDNALYAIKKAQDMLAKAEAMMSIE